MLEMEEEAKKQQKLDAYFEKTEKIINQKKTLPNPLSIRESQDDNHSPPNSSEEKKIKYKIMAFDMKMQLAEERRQQALERERERIQSQYEHIREKRN